MSLKPMRKNEKPVPRCDTEDFARAEQNAKTLMDLFNLNKKELKTAPETGGDSYDSLTISRSAYMLSEAIESLRILAQITHQCEDLSPGVKAATIQECIKNLNDIKNTIDVYMRADRKKGVVNQRGWSKTHGFMPAMNKSVTALTDMRYYQRQLQASI